MKILLIILLPLSLFAQPGKFSGFGSQSLPGNYPSATVGFSFRVLSVNNGRACMNVRRSSDNATQDIAFVNGEFDVASFSSFIGGGSGYCVTWYNQISSTLDATQATQANQPQITLSAHGNGKPSLFFDGTDILEIASSTGSFNYLHSTTGSVAIVAQPGTSSDPNANIAFFGNNAALTANRGIYFSFDDRASVPINNAYRMMITRGGSWNDQYASADNKVTPNIFSLIQVTFNPSHATANQRDFVYVNTVYTTSLNASTNTVSASNATYNMQIGAAGNSAALFNGYISEIVFYNTILTADQLSRQANNQNFHYRIY